MGLVSSVGVFCRWGFAAKRCVASLSKQQVNLQKMKEKMKRVPKSPGFKPVPVENRSFSRCLEAARSDTVPGGFGQG